MREAQAEANRLRGFPPGKRRRRAEERERERRGRAAEEEEKERRLRRLRETVAPVVARDAKRAVGGGGGRGDDVSLSIHTTHLLSYVHAHLVCFEPISPPRQPNRIKHDAYIPESSLNSPLNE